jgi:hypothetical protein
VQLDRQASDPTAFMRGCSGSHDQEAITAGELFKVCFYLSVRNSTMAQVQPSAAMALTNEVKPRSSTVGPDGEEEEEEDAWELDESYFARTYRPLSNLPTPPPSAKASIATTSSDTLLDADETLDPIYLGRPKGLKPE